MSPKLYSSFIFLNFYDVLVLAAIMITYQVLVFAILDQAEFESDAKQMWDLKDALSC